MITQNKSTKRAVFGNEGRSIYLVYSCFPTLTGGYITINLQRLAYT